MKSYTQFAIVASLMLCGCQAANELFDGRLNDLTSSGTAQPTKIGCAPADEQDTDGFFASALEIDQQQDETFPVPNHCLRVGLSDSVRLVEPAGVVAGLKVTDCFGEPLDLSSVNFTVLNDETAHEFTGINGAGSVFIDEAGSSFQYDLSLA